MGIAAKVEFLFSYSFIPVAEALLRRSDILIATELCPVAIVAKAINSTHGPCCGGS